MVGNQTGKNFRDNPKIANPSALLEFMSSIMPETCQRALFLYNSLWHKYFRYPEECSSSFRRAIRKSREFSTLQTARERQSATKIGSADQSPVYCSIEIVLATRITLHYCK